MNNYLKLSNGLELKRGQTNNRINCGSVHWRSAIIRHCASRNQTYNCFHYQSGHSSRWYVTGLTTELNHRCPLRWRHNEWGGVSNHQPKDCLLNHLSGCKSKKTSKTRVTGLCAGNSPGTGEFPAQMVSCAETVSIWWRHHASNAYMPR